MKVLITGGCGFIGHHLVEHLYKTTDWELIVIDKLSYATRGFDRFRNNGLLNNISNINTKGTEGRFKLFTWDLCSPLSDGMIYELGDINYIIHMAAETHVDNSISNPVYFMKNNIDMTINLLEYARKLKNLQEFLYFSTDEVFGPASFNINDTNQEADKYSYSEWDRHRPTNPYSASKSASENICLSYQNTYKLPLKIINVMNAFGERQHVEKFIPKVIKSLLNNQSIEIHSDNNMNSGTRFYIHARNIADAVLFIIKNGKQGDKFNITGEREISNLEMAQTIADIMNIPLKYTMENDNLNRPGHDLRYSLDGSKLIEMGWKHPVSFSESLRKTIEWTVKNPEWLNW